MNLFRRFALATGFAATAFAVTQESQKQPVVPKPAKIDRYQEMISKSPFAPATAAVEPVVTESFASDFYVSSLAKIGDKDVVGIRTTDLDPLKPTITLVSGENDSASGMKLLGVEWADPVNNSRVNIDRGGEKGTLKFNESVMSQRPAAPVFQPQPGQQPNQPGAPGQGQANVQRPVTMPNGQRIPGTTGRLQVQPNMPPNAIPPNAANPGVPRPGETRRRIRIINSTP